MTQWLASLSPRERMMVLVAIPTVVALTLYGAVWDPLQQSLAAERKRLEKHRTDLEWVQQAAGEIERLRAGESARPQIASAGQSPLIVVDRTAKAQQLGAALRRVEPDGRDGVKVSLEDAPFDQLMRWLALLEVEHGISVVSFTLSRRDRPGTVQARIDLRRGEL